MILMINGREIPVTVFDPEDDSTLPRGWLWDEDLGLTVPYAHAMGGVESILGYDDQNGWGRCETLVSKGTPWVSAHALFKAFPPAVPGHREVEASSGPAETKAGPKQERTPDHIRIARLEEEVRNLRQLSELRTEQSQNRGDLARQHSARIEQAEAKLADAIRLGTELQTHAQKLAVLEARLTKLEETCSGAFGLHANRFDALEKSVDEQVVDLHGRMNNQGLRLTKLEAKPTEMNVTLDVNNLMVQELGKREERFADSLEQLAARADALEESRSSMRTWVTGLEEELAKVKAQVGDADLAGRADRFEEALENVLRTQSAHLEAIERLTEKVNDLEGMSEGRRAEAQLYGLKRALEIVEDCKSLAEAMGRLQAAVAGRKP